MVELGAILRDGFDVDMPAFRLWLAELNGRQAANALGWLAYTDIAARNAATGVAVNKIAIVTRNNGSASDPANGFYQKFDAGNTDWERADWLEDLIIAVLGDMLTETQLLSAAIATPVTYSSRVPIVMDSAGKIALWLENGKLDVAQGLTTRLISTLAPALAAYFGPKVSPASSAVPIATDGRTLYQWRARLAQFRQAGTGKLRVMVMGDSWAEQQPVSAGLAALLRTAIADGGGGWISVNGNVAGLEPLDGAEFSRDNNWTFFDAAPNDFPATLPAIGCAHDGFALYTSGTTATCTFSFTGTAFRLFWMKGTGSFRYRIDAGSWTTVPGDGSNDSAHVTVTGLSAGSHDVDVDTTGNAGQIGIAGLYFYEAAAGVEVLKCGNGNLAGNQLITYAATHVAPILDVIAPDVVVLDLGGNDAFNPGNSPATLKAAIGAMIDATRAVLPDIGFILYAQADLDGATLTPLTDYRDALYALAIAKGVEFYNAHDDWGAHAAEAALGQWADAKHPSTIGGRRIASAIHSRFLA